LNRLKVCKGKLNTDGLNITFGINPAIHMHHIVIFETPNHMDNGTHLPDKYSKKYKI